MLKIIKGHSVCAKNNINPFPGCPASNICTGRPKKNMV